MKTPKSFLIMLLPVLAAGFCPATETLADDGDNAQITPVVTVAPNLFAVGQFASTFVCVSNGNPSSSKSIQGGDSFKLTFDPSIGVVATVASPVLVNSTNLNGADFTASLGSVANQIVITYRGASKVFTPGDSFCVKVNFAAHNIIGSGKITGESPSSGSDQGRYNKIDPKHTTISIVDFATGPEGPPGPGSVTSVSASNPLTVTNATTTPNISLGIVPPVNGGTGLSSVGASGNFLRSSGSAWTSGPLSASDIPDLGGSYIRNATALQSSTNFNIGGTGTANIFDAAMQFNLGGNRILSNPGTNNLFAGTDAGVSNTTGNANALFGRNAGQANTTGSSNSFVGNNAGAGNTTGGHNSFFGDAAGFRNAAGNDNSFFGFLAGFHNTAGGNSFFGSLAGADNTNGSGNSFFGNLAGSGNTTGGVNSFFGVRAGSVNTTGSSNSFFGSLAGQANRVGNENSFFGNEAGFSSAGNENSFFGSLAGKSNTTGGGNSFFGRSAGTLNSTGSGNVFVGAIAGLGNTTGNNNTLLGTQANLGAGNLSFATAIGSGAFVNSSNTLVLGRISDSVQVPGALSVTGALNVGGSFGANVLNAGTQFNIGGLRILSASGPHNDSEFNLQASNTFLGEGAGLNNTPNPDPTTYEGKFNSFVGASAGGSNTTGGSNSFFGVATGAGNTTGYSNSFFGFAAGEFNTTGLENVFVGTLAGRFNTTGTSNTFIGRLSGSGNQTGGFNAFVGESAGFSSQSGDVNAFFGAGSGGNNVDGSRNTYLGSGAGSQSFSARNSTMVGYAANFENINNSNLNFATAIGSHARVSASDTIVIGKVSGTYDSVVRPADTVQIPGGLSVAGAHGIGTTAPKTKLHLKGGKIYVEANGQGVVLKSPGGACFELSVTDTGALATAAVTCP